MGTREAELRHFQVAVDTLDRRNIDAGSWSNYSP